MLSLLRKKNTQQILQHLWCNRLVGCGKLIETYKKTLKLQRFISLTKAFLSCTLFLLTKKNEAKIEQIQNMINFVLNLFSFSITLCSFQDSAFLSVLSTEGFYFLKNATRNLQNYSTSSLLSLTRSSLFLTPLISLISANILRVKILPNTPV